MRQSPPAISRTNAMIKFTDAKSAAPKNVASKGDDAVAERAEPKKSEAVLEPKAAKTPMPKGKKSARK
jgi:hypothetical protein